MKKILLIHGPNLNMLGIREPDTYGVENFSDINNMLEDYSKTLNVVLEIFQSNTEGEIVNKIQSALNNYDGIIINPAAYTHTSVAIADAIAAVNIPTIEVHLSNIYSREAFRHHSFIAPVCIGQISGFKSLSYKLALDAIVQHLNNM